MRILFSSLGTHGHAYPLLPLAKAALDHGHDVQYATNEAFHAPLKKVGLTVIDAGISLGRAFGLACAKLGIDRIGPASGQHDVGAVSAQAFGTLLPRAFAADIGSALARLKPDLVVFEACNPGAGIAALRAGIPAVCHGFGLLESAAATPAINDGVCRVAASLGVTAPREGYSFLLDQRYLDIFPASLQDPDGLSSVERMPIRPVPFAEPGDLPSCVRNRTRPLVYLTLGTAMTAPKVLVTALRGLSSLAAEVLVATGRRMDPSFLPDLPSNVHVEQWVPQASLMDHVDLVVHHGGSGTTVSALTSAVPQLIMPMGADQFHNANAVVSGGLGTQLVGRAVTADTVFTEASRLLEDAAVRKAGNAIAEEIAAMPHPDEVLSSLEQLAG